MELLEPRRVLDSTLVLNEIMYNPVGGDESLEWIELYNQMATNLDVSKWRFDSGVQFTFPQGTVVPAGGYLVVAANPTALAAAGVYSGALGPWIGSLANGGEQLELVNNSDAVMDLLAYGDSGEWPSAADGSGASLAKFDELLAGASPTNWLASRTVGGTPGSLNFPPPGNVTVPSGVVSYWNFDEASGAAVDRADGNNGSLGGGAARVAGPIGAGAIAFDDTKAAYVNVGIGTANNFATTTGVTIEAAIAPTWDAAGQATIFRKNEAVGAPLVSYWSFDETNGTPANSNVLDYVGGNNGALAGTAAHTTGIRGLGAGRFNDANAEAVTLSAGGNFSVSAGITIGAWIKPEWTGLAFAYDTIFYKNDATTRMSLEFQRDSSNTTAEPAVAGSLPQVLSFGLNTNGAVRELDMPLGVNLSLLPNGAANAGTIYLTTPAVALGPTDVVLRDGNSHYVTATYDVGTGEKAIWIDGLKRWFINYAPGTPVATGGAVSATIGNLAAGSARAFKGVIDEVAIWGDALNATQITALAAVAPAITPLEVPGASGVNNRIQLALQNDGNNALANPPVAAGPVLSFGLNVGGAYSELDMPLDGVAGRPTLAALQNGLLHHVAASYDSASGEKAIFIDGVKRWSVALTPGATIQSGGDGLTVIGNSYPGGAESFAGKIDEVAFWNRAFSSTDAQQHATAVDTNHDYFTTFNLQVAALALSETAPGGADFWLEIVNYGAAAVELGGHVLQGSENPLHRYVFPAQLLAPGGFVVVGAAQLGFTPVDGDRIFLFEPSETAVVDAATIDNQLRGRLPQATGPWLFPAAATAGAANNVPLHDEIVINEIMYHAQPQFAQPAQVSTTQPVALGSSWQFEQSNTDLSATAWKNVGYVPAGWSTGAATLGATVGGASYASVVQSDAPLAYWRLGDAGPTTVADSSGNGRTGTAGAGVLFGRPSLLGSDATNKAVNTVGTSRITTAGFEKFPVGSTGYSVEYWIKLNAAPTGFANIVGDGEQGGDFYLMNYLTSSGQIRPHFNGAGTTAIDSSATLAVGQTYHVVTTWDKTTGLGSIYINGVLDKAINVGTGAPVNTNNPVYLGRDNREPGADFILDDVAIYNRPLTSGEIVEHYTAGGGVTIATPLTLDPTTFYFRQEFTFDGNPANTALTLRTLIDDGAVVYLNGQEVYRQNMPDGAIGHTTLAAAPVGTASLSGDIPILATLNVGLNVLAVEVHQATLGDADVTFAAELTATENLTANAAFAESEAEWVELFNRSATTVDLSGWRFDDAMDFTFPANTTIAPGEYIVVAKSAALLAAQYPGIRIFGDYTGQLANSSERIVLLDNRKNPADTVTYASEGRWSSYADGGGTSLELRDPDADNSQPEAWAASDESARSTWQTYTYRGIAANPPNSNNPVAYNEFILGLLDAGEVLLDDISVRENPDGANTEFLQNGSFAADALGGSAAKWRILGTHHGTVIADPDNAANKVLRLVATGPAEHLANHGETTLKSGATFETVQLGAEYEISFRAKWIAGSPQLNTRLFFNLLPKTTILATPTHSGTPGAKNSILGATAVGAANIGPTYSQLAATPITPTSGQAVVVSVQAADPNGVQSLTLKYSVNGGAMASVPMALSTGVYSGTIPGQLAGAIVQFYVEGSDNLGAVSSFPAAAGASRALYKVGTSATSAALHNLQIIMTATDAALLNAPTNQMSNDFLGATVVYQGRAYYDVGVRLKGSEHGRPDVNRRGYFVQFPPDNLFRGVQRSIGIDRSGGWRYGRTFGQEEIVIHQFMRQAGDIPGSYTDLINVEAPGVPTGTAILQMGRFTNQYLDSQFENGGDGTRYEYELVYGMLPSVPGDVESVKYAQEGPSADGILIRDLGDDREAYRNNFLIKNNLDEDTYAGVMAMAKALGQPAGSAAYFAATQATLDVDQWLRAFAAGALAAVGDNYFAGAGHNATFYQRPSDGKMLLFPQDMDFAFMINPPPLVANTDLANLLLSPTNNHNFLGHLQHIVATSFNAANLGPWISYYNSLLPGQNITDLTAYVDTRANYALSQLPAMTSFDVFAVPATVNASTVAISGRGWVNVRELRVQGRPGVIDVAWTTTTAWQGTLVLDAGPRAYTIEAYDYSGNLIGSEAVNINSTVAGPSANALRVTELMYHPGNRTAAEIAAGFANDDEFEFIEIQNTGAATVDLTGVEIAGGVSFAFTGSPVTSLAPGQYVLVVANMAAFAMRYNAAGLQVAGAYSGQLNNSGEELQLLNNLHLPIQTFTYDDAWYPSTDGPGQSLVIVNPLAPTSAWNDAAGWRASTASGGSPGLADPVASVVGRHAFYNNSKLDGNDAAASANDDAAIAPDKAALLPGGTATFANYTGYSRGINGIIVDFAGSTAALVVGDFAFRVGNNDAPSGWASAPGVPTMSIRTGAGAGGSNRITLIWPDGAIKNQWLEVTLAANAHTGLFAPDVFYFGNAVGETGDSLASALVNATDEVATRNHPQTFLTPAGATNLYDFNRDGLVNATDQILARANSTTVATALKLIHPPAGLAAATAAVETPTAESTVTASIDVSMFAAGLYSRTQTIAVGPAPPAPSTSDALASITDRSAAYGTADSSCRIAVGDYFASHASELPDDSEDDLFELLATSQLSGNAGRKRLACRQF